jgi:hypothetical protein
VTQRSRSAGVFSQFTDTVSLPCPAWALAIGKSEDIICADLRYFILISLEVEMLFFGSKSVSTSLELVILPNPAIAFQAAAPRRFHPGWMYCAVTNDSREPIFVYGARHESETTTIPTSLFLLAAGRCTPPFWDCKGLLIPQGSVAQVNGEVVRAPVAVKYRDFRRVRVRVKNGVYLCPRHNGLLTGEQVEFPAPPLTYLQLLACPRRIVRAR